MFVRIKKSGHNQYLQVIENCWEGNRSTQRVIATLGRLNRMQVTGEASNIPLSLSRFSEQMMLILSVRASR